MFDLDRFSDFQEEGTTGTYTISKEFHFSYAHVLEGLPEGHPCGNMHGHNGILVVVLEGTELNEAGFVMDYRDMSPLKEFVDNAIDHKLLNDVFTFQPSSENMAKWFYGLCKEFGWPVKRVSWSETPKTWCHYEEK